MEKTKLQKLDQLTSVVGLMDSKFSFLGFSFGIDALIGLIPGFGDIVGGLISLLILLRIRSIGISDEIFNKMLKNVLIDVFVGSVPLLGDAFDFFFKVNERNMRLARAHFESSQSE